MAFSVETLLTSSQNEADSLGSSWPRLPPEALGCYLTRQVMARESVDARAVLSFLGPVLV